ncbi:MAG: putative metal-binding motif-containing protein [Alphaproteobacteria bacterium]|nr:putative metal-binding motif-containing protein [Alphaproteobacteria bacterium]
MIVLLLSGCGFVPEGWYDANVRDVDGDGSVSVRFGGRDCDDLDPLLVDCDADRDGFLTTGAGGDDCDDARADVHPGAAERCNGIDDDCDGSIDEQAVDGATWYADLDADGHGDPDSPITACAQPARHVAATGDCDDDDPAVHPGAVELCDALDRDCDGRPTEGAAGLVELFVDADGDGYGAGPPVASSCPDAVPDGLSPWSTDCDDTDALVSPGAVEDPDGVDSDCDPSNDDDFDGDGVPRVDDCDDADPAVFPGAREDCNGVDDDCDGIVDDVGIAGLGAQVFFVDQDEDGHGRADAPVALCALIPPPGFAILPDDCDDLDDRRYPGRAETCDNLDNDCDGQADEGAVDGRDWFTDADGDGYGRADQVLRACALPPGFADNALDCNDIDPSAFPGAPEVCGDNARQDCSSTRDPADCDGDGALDALFGGTDCDDTNAAVGPTATEICDGRDNDCDGLLDDADDSLDDTVILTFLRDHDHDGFGEAVVTTSDVQCTPPPDTVANTAIDCDDDDATVYPGATETCDGRDNDCDGLADDDDPVVLGAPTRWLDVDGDGAGDPSVVLNGVCTPADPRWVLAQDCDDDDPDVHPGADEVCDGIDDDCDGLVDDADPDVLATSWYRNADGDAFGDASVVLVQCLQPAGYASVAGDCDDSDAAVGADRDWFRDADGDGYGTPDDVVADCYPRPGRVERADDCDDTAASVSPAAPELCDGIDDDCDGLVDDDDPGVVNAPSWFADADRDGWGDPSTDVRACARPAGASPIAGDCDDDDPGVAPGLLETCDGIDDDCDGLVDDDDPGVVATNWYRDSDGDGAGSPASTVSACVAPAGFVSDATDCDDQLSAVQAEGQVVRISDPAGLDAALASSCLDLGVRVPSGAWGPLAVPRHRTIIGSPVGDTVLDVRLAVDSGAVATVEDVVLAGVTTVFGELVLQHATVEGPLVVHGLAELEDVVLTGTVDPLVDVPGGTAVVTGALMQPAGPVTAVFVADGVVVLEDVELTGFRSTQQMIAAENSTVALFDVRAVGQEAGLVKALGGSVVGRGVTAEGTDFTTQAQLALSSGASADLEDLRVVQHGGAPAIVLAGGGDLTLASSTLLSTKGGLPSVRADGSGTMRVTDSLIGGRFASAAILGNASDFTVARSTLVSTLSPASAAGLVLQDSLAVGTSPCAIQSSTGSFGNVSGCGTVVATGVQTFGAGLSWLLWDLHPAQGSPAIGVAGWESGSPWFDDLDADTLPDGWELAAFGTLAHGPDGDPDADGLTTLQELSGGTSPALRDTDSDGIDDRNDPTPLTP